MSKKSARKIFLSVFIILFSIVHCAQCLAKPERGKSVRIVASGTGFFIDKDIVVTNSHVIAKGTGLIIVLANGRTVGATVRDLAAFDKSSDLAVLKLSRAVNVRPLRLGNSGTVKPGEKVFAIGHPLSAALSSSAKISEGIINSLAGANDNHKLFQISIPIQPGNSGGPMFNDRGEVVGITSAGLRAAQNVNFAVKINELNRLLRKNNIKVPFADLHGLNVRQDFDATQIMEFFEQAVVRIMVKG
ncbi:MAG: serine protease [Acidaminococcales bacterium]|nr:serine protease [Acidaminococcales bacterium]